MTCPDCQGHGKLYDEETDDWTGPECPDCGGNGELDATCGHCSGSGEGAYDGAICAVCRGAGVYPECEERDDYDDQEEMRWI